jgi:hypothetical protein
MLTSKDIITINLDVILNRPHSVTGPEAEACYREFAANVEKAAKEGRVIGIPFEFPMMTEGGEGP